MSALKVPEWEIAEGLPQFTDPFIQQYLSGRASLIDEEKTTRSDAPFRGSLNAMAREACHIVSRIRTSERQSIWSADAEMSGHSFPGMPFALARERMESSKLWKVVSRMPKGALLHAHIDAMIDIDWLVEEALNVDGMGFWASGDPMAGKDWWEDAAIGFKFTGNHPKMGEEESSIWSGKYVSGSCVPATKAADIFPQGGRQGFKDWLLRRCAITAEESLDHHHGLNLIWSKFGSCFPIINTMLMYEPIFRVAVQRLLSELLEDGIRWVDFRAAFVFEYYRDGHTQPETDYTAFFQAFKEELEKFQATDAGSHFWGARFIWTTLRFHSKREIVDNMKLCFAAKAKFPSLICGFDLVGQEDRGRPLADLTPEIFWFRKRCVEEGVEIPFFFHAGECLGDGDSTDENLFDAVLLGTRRIGHGFSLYKHPLLIEMCKQKSILIESCPISNEILRLSNSINSHPLPALLARGVQVALCNDDPAVLGHGRNGLTHDFWQALQGWENLGLEGLGSLAENSVRYAAFGPDQTAAEWKKDVKDGLYGQGIRAERMRKWVEEWNAFCEWVVVEFAADYGGDSEEEEE